MSGRTSQAKGRRAELIRAAGFPSVRAGAPLSYGCWPDVEGLPGIHCEVKRHEKVELAA